MHPISTDHPTRPAEMFHRVLSAWAMDCLHLRRAGLDRPSIRAGSWGLAGLGPRGLGGGTFGLLDEASRTAGQPARRAA